MPSSVPGIQQVIHWWRLPSNLWLLSSLGPAGGWPVLSSHLPKPCSLLCGLSPASLDFIPLLTLWVPLHLFPPTPSLLAFSEPFIKSPTLEKMDVTITGMIAEIFLSTCRLLEFFLVLSLQDRTVQWVRCNYYHPHPTEEQTEAQEWWTRTPSEVIGPQSSCSPQSTFNFS